LSGCIVDNDQEDNDWRREEERTDERDSIVGKERLMKMTKSDHMMGHMTSQETDGILRTDSADFPWNTAPFPLTRSV